MSFTIRSIGYRPKRALRLHAIVAHTLGDKTASKYCANSSSCESRIIDSIYELLKEVQERFGNKAGKVMKCTLRYDVTLQLHDSVA
ncbi:hypothetical protein [Paraburkholderia bannensis]|uniref:hypothetical protein n=1 Tax=Paraburkholderia bannensis TaxID=765414 RepID=UPI001427CB9C|nr:hypothetical protein [Paraburkholderia bannensis]